MKTINVLHIYQNSGIGGVQQQTLSVMKAYDKSRFRPFFCCFGKIGEIGLEMQAAGIEVIALNKKSVHWFSPSIIFELYRIMKGKNIHVVRTHRYRAGLYGRIAAILAGAPVVIQSFHDNYRKDARPERRAANRLLALFTDKIAAVSDSIGRDISKYDKVPEDKIVVIPNGVDTLRQPESEGASEVRASLSLSESDIVVGFTGRLVAAKGLEFLIRAFADAASEFDDLKLLIAGDGPLRRSLVELSESLGLGKKVVFAGHRRDIIQIMGITDIYVLPSVSEGLPNALLEAMASGRPVAASNIGGIPELIRDGENGLLLPPSDSGAIAAALKRLAADRELRQQLGASARKFMIDNFDMASTVGKWQDLYESLLAKKGDSA